VTIFEVLLAANAMLALIALVRRRPATCILLANICNILLGLSNIATYGQPRSMSFLPAAVFDSVQLRTASDILTIVTVIGAIAVALPASNRDESVVLPALPRWVLAALVAYFLTLAVTTKTIFYGTYGTLYSDASWIPLGGVLAFAEGLVFYELYRRTRAGLLTTNRAFFVLIAFLFITDYSKGSTGGATGFLFTASFLFLGQEGRTWQRVTKVGGALTAAFLLAFMVRQIRATLHSEGSRAVAEASETLATSEERRATTGQGIELNTNGLQNATHILQCALLYDSGYSREWRSLYLPVVYTFQPQFIMDLMGWERQLDAPWELAKYYIHGGGIAIFGEMYWNGGYPCVTIVTLITFLLAYFGDTRVSRSFGWSVFCCMFTPMLLPGIGYGLNYLFRGSSNALIAIGACKLASAKKPREQLARIETTNAPARA
jgi:hypothetical protein